MGRKSSIKGLPPEIVEEVNRLLSGGRFTLNQVRDHLRNLGVDGVSRSALGRHKQNLDKVLERLRQGREVAEILAEKIGPEAAEGRQGRALVQMIQALAGDYMMNRLENPDSELEAKELVALARTVKDASQASRYSQDFEMKIREEAAKEAQAKMEKAVASVVDSPESVRLSPAQLRQAILNAYGCGE